MADVVKIEGYDIRDAAAEADILDLETYLGYTDENVIGLQADFENNTFTRLGGAVGKSAGADFNVYNMYGNRKVCAVQDDGTISKWWGEEGYVEDGSIGQIMVRQPKFYYKVVPLKLQKITPEDDENYKGETTTAISIGSTTNPVMIGGTSTTIATDGAVKYDGVYYEWDGSAWIAYTQTDICGYHGVKMAYYISDKPLPGFKLHPAFINADGEEVDCYYIGSYEASLYDTSESAYRKYDTWSVTENGDDTYTINALNTYLADATNDKLCSIAGVKPATGEYSTQFTRPDVNQMGKNRGIGWGAINFKMASAEQLLFIIEYGLFNSQSSIETGVVLYVLGSHNESVFTGSTASLGNGSGAAISSTRLASDATTYETKNTADYKSIRYRGVENFWGNIWSYVSGVNIWGNGKMFGGQAYVCDDFNFTESKNDDNYKPIGFNICNGTQTYIKMIGWSEYYDWAFLPSKTANGANSARPVGDCTYATKKLNGYRNAILGGCWYRSVNVGSFCWTMAYGVGSHGRDIGARLIYID